MSAAEESKTAGVTATDGGYPAAGEGHGHAAHGEGKAHGEGHAHGDGHDCGVDHGDGHGDGHAHGGHGGHGGHGDGGHGHGADDGEGDDGEAPDMAGLEAMMGGMGGGGEGGAGGMDMSALMAMLGKGGGKGGGGGMDMASMMGGMGGGGGMGGMGKGGGKGGGAPPEDTDEKKGEKWVWMQKGEEVHIRFPLEPPVTNKKEIGVTFKSNTLKVVIRGETTLDGSLGGKVDVDDCTWCLSPAKDELQVMLTKVEGKTDAWRDLLA